MVIQIVQPQYISRKDMLTVMGEYDNYFSYYYWALHYLPLSFAKNRVGCSIFKNTCIL